LIRDHPDLVVNLLTSLVLHPSSLAKVDLRPVEDNLEETKDQVLERKILESSQVVLPIQVCKTASVAASVSKSFLIFCDEIKPKLNDGLIQQCGEVLSGLSQGKKHIGLGSVAGTVIQATGRSEFEDGLGSADFVLGYSYHMSVRTRLSDHTKQTKFQSQRPNDVETPVPSI
jgi:hypothetical protein